MKANKFFAFALATATLAACSSPAGDAVETTEEQAVQEVAGAQSYAVNTAASSLNWIGYKTHIDWSHNGTVAMKEGTLKVENGQVVGGTVVFDMSTIHSNDIPKDDENYGKLVGHLKSADFFDVANHPTATFEITGMNNGVVSGNLTMRGITKNISFPANVSMNGDVVEMTAPEFTIDRKQWNVSYNSTEALSGLSAAELKDKLIDDNIKLSFTLKAEKA